MSKCKDFTEIFHCWDCAEVGESTFKYRCGTEVRSAKIKFKKLKNYRNKAENTKLQKRGNYVK